MPMPDPLENVMSILRDSNFIDPNKAAAKKARLKQQRQAVGAVPAGKKLPPQQGAKGKAPPDMIPHTAGVPDGVHEDFQQQPNMMGVIIDALNEAIIGLKTEIHRSTDAEERKNLERQAQQIRQRITEMGGEPIYADETIEEGMKKLRGLGATGIEAFRQQNPLRDLMDRPSWEAHTPASPVAGTTPSRTPSWEKDGGTPVREGGLDALFGVQQPQQKMPSISAPTVRAQQVPVPEIPQTPSVIPDHYGQHVQVEEGPDQLEQLIERVTGREIQPPPEPVVDEAFVNRLIQQYNLEPRTPEEIGEVARAVVERQKMSQEQVIQAEIDRFNEEHPHEYEKAKKKIDAFAKELSADRQDEMSARGMFYSSIMANSLEKIDATSMDAITEIARDAANYVAGLNRELKDIAQWAVLEEEVLRRQLEEQERGHAQNLMMMQLEVATWGDQMAIDRWYKENAMQLQADQVALQGAQLKIQYADHKAQNLAAAFMADHPLVQDSMIKMGITPDAFGQMPMEQQAGLVRSIVGFNEVEQQMRMNELQMRAVVANIALQNAQLDLQAQISSGQFAMQAQGMALELAMHRDRMTLDTMIHRDRLSLDRIVHGDQMELAWANLRRQAGASGASLAEQQRQFDLTHGLRAAELEAAIGQNTGPGSIPLSYFEGLNDPVSLQYIKSLGEEKGDPFAVRYAEDSLARLQSQAPQPSTQRSMWDPKEWAIYPLAQQIGRMPETQATRQSWDDLWQNIVR